MCDHPHVGRHGAAGGRGRSPGRAARVVALVSLVVLLAGAVALGLWWWSLRDGGDPIDADPVSGYGIVVSSPACADMPPGARTVVTIIDVTPPTQARVDACGYRQGQRLAIEYLDGSPQEARLAGTTTGGSTDDTVRRLLPLAILLAGLLAVGAAVMLLRDQRAGRRAGSDQPGRVTVAELQSGLIAARDAAARHTAPGVPADVGARTAAVPVAATAPPAERADPSGGADLTDRADTDPGLGALPVFDDQREVVLDHVAEQPLLTHGSGDDASRPAQRPDS